MIKEIEQGEIRVDYPYMAHTKDIRTCIGIAAIDPEGGILGNAAGYLGHYHSLSPRYQRLINMFKEVENPGNLEVVVVGNRPMSKEELRTTGEDFDHMLALTNTYGQEVIEELRKLGITNINTDNLITEPEKKSFTLMVNTLARNIMVQDENSPNTFYFY